MKTSIDVKTSWIGNQNLTCVVICAGRGTRILPFSKEIPKTMILLNEKPILRYIIDYWKQYTKNFIFIVGYKKELIIEYVKTLDIDAQFVEQKKLNGIANAIALAKDLVPEHFIVVLGDCLCLGHFSFSQGMNMGIGIWETTNSEYIKTNYAVIVEHNLVKEVIEKPTKIFNDLCGMGVYFLTKKIFNYISMTPPSTLRNEIEITDVIQRMIHGDQKITPIYFSGDYINITFPSNVKRAEHLLTKNK